MIRYVYLTLCFISGFSLLLYATWLGFNAGPHVFPIGNDYVTLDKNQIVRLLFTIWLVTPPFLMLIDWVLFCGNYDLVRLDIVRHTHGLTRNIWIGALGLLVLLFGTGGWFHQP